MEITDFMGLLLPKSFTTDRLAKIYFCSIYHISLAEQRSFPVRSNYFPIRYYVLYRCHELCFLCPRSAVILVSYRTDV